MEPSFLEQFRAWGQRQERSGHGALPNLGLGGTLIAIFVCVFFGGYFADNLAVILGLGWHAFFIDGVRVADGKHGILSNGGTLPLALEFARRLWFFFGLILILLSELSAGFLRTFLLSRPRWVSNATCLLGGVLLFLFVRLFWLPRPLFHPIPLAASIGGAVLLLKGVVSIFRRDA